MDRPQSTPWAVVAQVASRVGLPEWDTGRREIVLADEATARLNAASMSAGGGYVDVELFRAEWMPEDNAPAVAAFAEQLAARRDEDGATTAGV